MPHTPPIAIYRLPAVLQVTGLSKATIYRLLERGEFPPRVQLSPRCVGWRVADVDAWLDARATASGLPPEDPGDGSDEEAHNWGRL